MIKLYRKYIGLSCKQATFLLSKREETALSFTENIRLRWHLLNCNPCTRFSKQIIIIEKAMKNLFGDTTPLNQQFSSEKKSELEKLIQQNLPN